ncbi:uncharacterized protein LOC103828897 [Brassica rapa]|uniref:uncharacterized protein LOC103828897 n=1 Tax=Brassica campestris TaxID=3711 RepID=UPI0004F17F5B|nr:uncharacterized protein LOC103828897 [Brassica rapa]
MSVSSHATVNDVIIHHRRRRHRVQRYNDVEDIIDSTRELIAEGDDVSLWKRGSDYHTMFSTYETWELIRVVQHKCGWEKIVCFSQVTPKYSFITWLAMHNRLSTMDLRWNMAIPPQCALCNNLVETRNYLFFSCEFSSWIWRNLTKGISHSNHMSWNEIIRLLSGSQMDFKSRLCIRYAMQAAIHMIWCEKNKRLHGKAPRSA